MHGFLDACNRSCADKPCGPVCRIRSIISPLPMQIPLANDPCGRTALSAAVMLAWEGMVAVLLELGCPVTVRDGTGNLPLHGAATEAATRSPGQLQAVMRRLLHAGACISCRAPDQKQPLHFAAEWAEGRTHVIEFLVAQGADVGALDAEGCSPLIIATYRVRRRGWVPACRHVPCCTHQPTHLPACLPSPHGRCLA